MAPDPAPTRAALDAAFRALRRVAPDAARVIAESLPGPVQVVVGDEPEFVVVAERAGLSTRGAMSAGVAAVSVELSRRAARDLVRGDSSLLDALRSGSVEVWGRVTVLVALEGALHRFLTAAVGVSEIQSIVERWEGTNHDQ